MPRPKILSVGQCGYDGGRIGEGFAARYDAEVIAADTHEDARDELSRGGFDLVLVNRVGDLDGASGLELIRSMKKDSVTAPVPVLLVSNLADAQSEAVSIGAVPGFGKADLGTAKERAAIEAILSPRSV